jgi:adenosine kinase
MSGVRILGMGNPLLDISATVTDLSLCDKYGLKMGNACLAGPEHANLYTDIVSTFADKVQYIAGGATQNSIRVAQWVSGVAGLTAYIGCVGADEYGKTLAKCAEDEGVKPLYQIVDAKATGTCAVLVHETERTLCANLAAAEALTASFIETEGPAAAIQSCGIVYNAGFPLTHDGGAAIAAALGKHCAENGKIYATNLSAPFICQVSATSMHVHTVSCRISVWVPIVSHSPRAGTPTFRRTFTSHLCPSCV